mmetsp:Transcript_5273/g.19744  ORF Transcript_5273/g.19744 Transcript_5273/m.19744 type:complete len:784 (+) Transcript_5273:75-2426(+)
MSGACDYCHTAKALVFCRADSARLCLACDAQVHTANHFSQRHARSWLCERCHDAGGTVACSASRAVLCDTCDDHTRSVNKETHLLRTPLRSFTLVDDPDGFGMKHPAHARAASRHPFREGIFLFPAACSFAPVAKRVGGTNGLTQTPRYSDGSLDGSDQNQGSGGGGSLEGETENEGGPLDEQGLRSDFVGAKDFASGTRWGDGNALLHSMHPRHLPTQFPNPGSLGNGFPENAFQQHRLDPGTADQTECRDLLRQNSGGDLSRAVGGAFMSFDGDSLEDTGERGSFALGSVQSARREIGDSLGANNSSWGVPRCVPVAHGIDNSGERYGSYPRSGPAGHQDTQTYLPALDQVGQYGAYVLPDAPIGGFNTGSFPPLQGGYETERFQELITPGKHQHSARGPPGPIREPGYGQREYQVFYGANGAGGGPMPRDGGARNRGQTVNAAPPQNRGASPYQHTAGGTNTVLRKGAGHGTEPPLMPRPWNGFAEPLASRGVPTNSGWAPDATAAMAYPHYLHGHDSYRAFYEKRDGTGGSNPAASGPSRDSARTQQTLTCGSPSCDGGTTGGCVTGGDDVRVNGPRISQGSVGNDGGGGSEVLAVSSLLHEAHRVYQVGETRFPAGGDAEDDVRSSAGALAPGTKAREEMLVRYLKKRKERHFKKQIRYASRKVRADNRVRIKGRFARADAPLLAIDASSAKNHADLKKEEEDAAVVRDAAVHDPGDETADSDLSDAEGADVGKRARGPSTGFAEDSGPTKKVKIEHHVVTLGVSVLAAPDVPPGACV